MSKLQQRYGFFSEKAWDLPTESVAQSGCAQLQNLISCSIAMQYVFCVSERRFLRHADTDIHCLAARHGHDIGGRIYFRVTST